MPGHFPDTIDHFLSHSDGAGRLLAHAGLLLRLGRIYDGAAPAHLAAASRVANFKSGMVVIHADNGAVAIKLRQMAPTLTRVFSDRGIQCTGVTVKVQAIEINEHSSQGHVKPLPASAGQELAQLASAMPDTPLRAAIEALLERSVRTAPE